MSFTILDVVLLIVLTGFVAFGYALGFIHTLGAVVGVVFGTWTAGMFYKVVGGWLTPLVLGNENLAFTVAFILIFILANRLIGVVFWLADKVYHFLSFIPFTKTINRLLGAALGFAEGLFALSLFLYVAARFPFAPWFAQQFEISPVSHFILRLADWFTWLLPDVLRQVTALS